MFFQKLNQFSLRSFLRVFILIFLVVSFGIVSPQILHTQAEAAPVTTLGAQIGDGGPLKSVVNDGPHIVNIPDLIAGARYKIVVSGWYRYQRYTNNNSTTDAQWDDWQQNHDNCFCRHVNKIQLNGGSPDASDYQTQSAKDSHTYTYLWTANSTNLEMYITDTYFHDNLGDLSYKMFLDALPAEASKPTTKISLDLLLHGIGKAGDSENPGAAGGGNMDPKNKEREVQMDIYNTENQKIKSMQVKVTFIPESGSFKGVAEVGDEITDGDYLVKVKFPQSLEKQIGEIRTLKKGILNILPQASFVTGDINNDGAVSFIVLDYNIFLECINKTVNCSPAQKKQSDLSDNDIVDQFDFNLFMREITNVIQ